MLTATATAFQSTPPVKAATHNVYLLLRIIISIHAAREGGDEQYQKIAFSVDISIHAAREGGDQSILPYKASAEISIHAAREGGDVLAFT